MPRPKDVLQGTLDLLVLKVLSSRAALHGYGIAAQIEQASTILRVEEGSLYPALHRMAQEGLISSEWAVTETNRRARFYRLSSAGRKRLAEEETKWRNLTAAVDMVLRIA